MKLKLTLLIHYRHEAHFVVVQGFFFVLRDEFLASFIIKPALVDGIVRSPPLRADHARLADFAGVGSSERSQVCNPS